ncbi:hypothetical protein WAK64_13465 [Bacillus spongiae]|uniref:Glutaredoxin domain-containing protein n=1 Tax=Bacillus spongiae TaxID=2683610 RepID=A0ABU8HG80_9BACI
MILYIMPSCYKCEEVLQLFSKLNIQVKVVNIFDRIEDNQQLTFDKGLPALELDNELLDYDKIMKRYKDEV